MFWEAGTWPDASGTSPINKTYPRAQSLVHRWGPALLSDEGSLGHFSLLFFLGLSLCFQINCISLLHLCWGTILDVHKHRGKHCTIEKRALLSVQNLTLSILRKEKNKQANNNNKKQSIQKNTEEHKHTWRAKMLLDTVSSVAYTCY